MTTTIPIDMFGSFIRLHPDGGADETEQVFGSGQEGWHVMTFHVETDDDVHGDHWEIDMEADELVACLHGGIRMYLREDDSGSPEVDVPVPKGHAVVVPQGRWHRIELAGPSDIMSITVPRGSRLERR